MDRCVHEHNRKVFLSLDRLLRDAGMKNSYELYKSALQDLNDRAAAPRCDKCPPLTEAEQVNWLSQCMMVATMMLTDELRAARVQKATPWWRRLLGRK